MIWLKIPQEDGTEFCSMKTSSTELLQRMQQELNTQRHLLEQLKVIENAALSSRPGENSWSAFECLAHLNSYAAHYNPAFLQSMYRAKERGWQPDPVFRGTWLGAYCIKSIHPENRKTSKLRTPARHNKLGVAGERKEFERLEKHLAEQEQLLKQAGEINLNRCKVAIEIMPWLRLRLGDFFPFLIYHQTRHLHQAMEAAGLHVENTHQSEQVM